MAEAPTPAEANPEQNPDAPPPADPTGSASGEGASGNREAAKYRTKLREAETKLDAYEARVNALLRKEIEAHAASKLAVGADLFEIGGANIDDLTDPEGNVMPDAVDAAVAALLDKRPGLRNGSAPWGDVGGGRREVAAGPLRMQDALQFKGR